MYGNNFIYTVGKFLGVNENKLLNLDSKPNKNLGWSLSYGLHILLYWLFYVSNYDKSYQLDRIKRYYCSGCITRYLRKLVVLSLSYKILNL